MATPFSDEKFTFTQPDGSKLEVRGWGNQYAARFETLDGYTVTKNPQSGFWEIATVSADGRGVVPVSGASSAADGGRSQASRPVDARLAVQTSPIQPGKMRWEQRRAERKQQTLAAGGPLAAPPSAPPQASTSVYAC